jgi:hypothetical protein
MMQQMLVQKLDLSRNGRTVYAQNRSIADMKLEAVRILKDIHPASAAFLRTDGTVDGPMVDDTGSDGHGLGTDTDTDGRTAKPEERFALFSVSGTSPFEYGVAVVPQTRATLSSDVDILPVYAAQTTPYGGTVPKQMTPGVGAATKRRGGEESSGDQQLTSGVRARLDPRAAEDAHNTAPAYVPRPGKRCKVVPAEPSCCPSTTANL